MFDRFNKLVLASKLRRSLGISYSAFAIDAARRRFSHEHYSATYPELGLASEPESWAHFLETGWREGRDPSPDFETRAYLDTNADVAAAGVNPFLHYWIHGWGEGRLSTAAQIEAQHLRAKFASDYSAEAFASARDAFSHEYYAENYPELSLNSASETWAHFLETGWREGKNPSPDFETSAFLDANPDIAAAGLNPFLHYIAHGREEGRNPRPSESELEKLEPTFCVHPFLEVNILAAGTVRPCCAFYPTLSENGRPISVYEKTVEEIWNSDAMRTVRRDLVEGRRTSGCSYCFDFSHAKSGVATFREVNSKSWRGGYMNPGKETYSDLITEARENDYFLARGPRWIDLDVGNLCNLKCRMCMPASSSSVANDPVQSRWTPPYEIPARWQGNTMTIAPTRVLGVSYSGLSEVDRSYEQFVSWILGTATLDIGAELKDTDTFDVSLLSDGPASVQIYLNDNLVANEEMQGKWNRRYPFPSAIGEASRLQFRIVVEGRVGIMGLSIQRSEKGRSNIGMSRFQSGKTWYQEESFLIEDALYSVKDVTKINLIGGEPMLIKEVVSTLKRLVDGGFSRNIAITTITNGSVYNQEFCELMERFREAVFGISIDGVGAVNEYIRGGSSWSNVDSNINKILTTKNSYLYANVTFQAYNMLHVVPLANYCFSKGLRLMHHYLQAPAYLACGVMPLAARQEAVRRIDEFLGTCSPAELEELCRLHIYQMFDRVRISISAEPRQHDVDRLREFIAFTNDLDATRGESFAKVNSDLMRFIEASGTEWSSETRYAKFGQTQPAL